MQSWLEGRNWIGKCAQATGMTASLRILSSKADSNTWESFTRSGLKLEWASTTLRCLQEKAYQATSETKTTSEASYLGSKGTLMMGRGISGLRGGVWGKVRWQVGQAWQNRFTLASRLGQWKRSRTRWVVFWPPKWPAIGCAGANSITISVLARGTTNRVFSSPLRCATQ